MTKKQDPASKAAAERVFMLYWAKDNMGDDWPAGVEYAKGKIANGSAALTPEAVKLMETEIAERDRRAAQLAEVRGQVPKPGLLLGALGVTLAIDFDATVVDVDDNILGGPTRHQQGTGVNVPITRTGMAHRLVLTSATDSRVLVELKLDDAVVPGYFVGLEASPHKVDSQ